MSLVQLFIATYNRPGIVLNAVKSALKQDFNSFDVILSDNSTNNETENLIKEIKDDRLIYIRRNPSLPAIDHLNAIIDDVTSEYFMIFHDDDIMYPEMISELIDCFSSRPNIIAAGANARIKTPGLFPDRLMLRKKFGSLLIQNRDEMAHQYLIKRGIVPFPSYLYKNEVARKIRLNPAYGGKHCDVAFIMEIATLGPILMSGKPLMDYYISKEQDSRTNSFMDRVRLINHIIKTTSLKRDSYLVKRFRVVNLYYEIIQDKKNKKYISWKRQGQILKLIFKVSPFDFFPRSIFHLLMIGPS